LRELQIDPDAIDPDDPQMLADIVLAAVNEGLRMAQELAASKLGAVSGDLGELGNLGGLGLPGL
jgi:DNA-binding protein YbaB